jgi:flavorubredoxin
VVTNPKCQEELKDLLLIPDDKFISVADRETLSLGDKTLEFIYTPWVHWPETMVTYLKEDQILFSCDWFGSHLATSDLYAHDEAKVYESAKRYYAEIMMPFRTSIKANLDKISGLEIKMIAPSHGPVYDRPEFIINAYQDWTSEAVKNEVVIPYVSMHGSVKAMIMYFIDQLIKKGVVVKPFDISQTDIGELAMALVDAATIVIGAPTVLAGVHPLAAHAAFLANALRPKAKFVSIIGSYSWGGKMVEQLAGLIPGLRVEIIPPVMAKGYPKAADFQALDQLAETIYNKHKEAIK